jgi:hypothetical protein
VITVRRCAVVAGVAALVMCASCSAQPDAPSSSTLSSSTPSFPSVTADVTVPTTTSELLPTTTPADPAGRLPEDLTPNAVEDECLLTADEFGTLTGRTGIRAENTELAGGEARRSCFYAPAIADEPAARIDVYASASLPPPELVTRIAANGGRALSGTEQGAVVVTGQDGATELVVASATLLAVLTVLPGTAVVPPSDQAWAAAATAMAGRLPR